MPAMVPPAQRALAPSVGAEVGCAVVAIVGELVVAGDVGAPVVGDEEGASVGASVGLPVVGTRVGARVGALVGGTSIEMPEQVGS